MVVVRGSISLTTRHRPHGRVRRHRSRIAQRKKRQHQRPDEPKPADPCRHSFDDKAVFLQIKARCYPGKFERRHFLSTLGDCSMLTVGPTSLPANSPTSSRYLHSRSVATLRFESPLTSLLIDSVANSLTLRAPIYVAASQSSPFARSFIPSLVRPFDINEQS
jgi:hypothetical protein